ncbi:hypothetical protein KUTeg_012790 [Tegillarca granosa]|uniref:Uncharacterized protein n=1 Tax=Tegillarca granosa TaxID=220873 RepID=A0ABQ9F0G6_TEGGR|nr:hypothetical protein KUTeg_012790 [Tegillarca granosa]
MTGALVMHMQEILPYMVMDIFSGFYGMPGLFLAALFCASLRYIYNETRIKKFELYLKKDGVVTIFGNYYFVPLGFYFKDYFNRMDSLSSDLSSLSALLLTDIIRLHCKPMSDIKATIIAKISVIGFGVLIVAIAFLVSMIGGTLTQIASTIVSAFSGPLEGLFLLACFVPYSNAKIGFGCDKTNFKTSKQPFKVHKGAITGTVISAIYCFWFAFGKSSSSRASRTQPLPPAPTNMCLPTNLTNGLDWLFDNSTDMLAKYTEYSTTALPVNQPELQGIDQMYSLSPTKVEDRDPRYLVPIFDELFCCLPESWRKHLRFGVDYSKRKDLENQKGNRSGDICNYTTIIEKNDGNGDPNQNYTVDSEKNKQTKETSDVTDTNSDDNESNEINDSNKAKNE